MNELGHNQPDSDFELKPYARMDGMSVQSAPLFSRRQYIGRSSAYGTSPDDIAAHASQPGFLPAVNQTIGR